MIEILAEDLKIINLWILLVYLFQVFIFLEVKHFWTIEDCSFL